MNSYKYTGKFDFYSHLGYYNIKNCQVIDILFLRRYAYLYLPGTPMGGAASQKLR